MNFFVDAARLLSIVLTISVAAACTGEPQPAAPTSMPELQPAVVLGADDRDGGTLFYRPTDVDIDGDGNVYVLDSGEARVFVFSPAGVPIGEFGRRGQGPGEFSFSNQDDQSAISVTDAHIVVMDSPGRTVKLFARADYEFAGQFRVPGTPLSVSATNDAIHLVIGGGERPVSIRRYSLAGELLGELESTIRDAWPHRHSSWTSVAAMEGPVVIEVFAWWPDVRLYKGDELVFETWLDFSWITAQGFRQVFQRTKEMAAGFDEAAMEDDRYLRVPIFIDMDAASESGDWFALLAGGVVQVLDPELAPIGTYRLRWSGHEESGLNPFAIATNDPGSVVCVTDAGRATVLCYRVDPRVTSSTRNAE